MFSRFPFTDVFRLNSSDTGGRWPTQKGLRVLALCVLLAAPVTSCVIPLDSGAEAAAIAIDQMEQAVYAMRDESAILQAQIDSLARELRKTDSLLRVIANLTGNPIIDPPRLTLPPPD